MKGITAEEYKSLKDSISLITVLIAGADGNIDSKEKSWAEKVTKIRSYTLPEGLRDFYLEVGEDFQERLDYFIDLYTGDIAWRNKQISDELAKLNDILPRIKNRELAIALYESLLGVAKHVARASGGFLSWGSISLREKRLLGLDMIKPLDKV